MSSALGLISTLATITSSPITLLGMIPILAVGLNYYRYTDVDPESAPIDAPVVSSLSCIINQLSNSIRFLSFQLRRHYDFIVVGAGTFCTM